MQHPRVSQPPSEGGVVPGAQLFGGTVAFMTGVSVFTFRRNRLRGTGGATAGAAAAAALRLAHHGEVRRRWGLGVQHIVVGGRGICFGGRVLRHNLEGRVDT